MKPYPIQFVPILKERIWGGQKLATQLNKDFQENKIGESWEISTVNEDVSTIANGSYKGKKLTELIAEFPSEVLGTEVFKRFGAEFPLLFKFIDANDDLSIQVHPNDELAKKRHNSFGKTEMWYIMQADEDARIIIGFKQKSSPNEYLKNLEDKKLVSILNEVRVKTGDVFFLATGTIHAIGAGILLAEIQQTSDITYRVYDWDRVDADGNARELHMELALEAINYNAVEAKRNYIKEENRSNEVVKCPYFTTNFIPLSGSMKIESNKKSFRVYMCVDGAFEIISNSEVSQYSKGASILVPASMEDFLLAGNASILEIYIS